MRLSPSLASFAAVLVSFSLLLTGCQCPMHKQGQGGSASNSGGHHGTPSGAATCHAAAVAFFNAYKAGNRAAAGKVATDAALNKLHWNASAGTNPTLKLVDDTHIYYEGGGIRSSWPPMPQAAAISARLC